MRQRKNVTISATIHPVVLRAFRKASRRISGKGTHLGGTIERIMVCWIMSDPMERAHAISAGWFDKHYMPNSRERKKHLREVAATIVKSRSRRGESERAGAALRGVA